MDIGGGRRSSRADAQPRSALFVRPVVFKTVTRFERVVEKLSVLVSFLFVAFVISLILAVAVSYVLVLRPLLRTVIPRAPYAILHEALSLWFLGNVAFNYVMVLTVAPGRPQPGDAESPAGTHPSLAMMQQAYNDNNNGSAAPQQSELSPFLQVAVDLEGHAAQSGPYLTSSQRWRWCKVCRAPKPPRAHHDSATGACVLQMCHYCPAVSRCVGLRNYQYFVRFILYTWTGTLFCAASCAWLQVRLPTAALQTWRGDVVFFGAFGSAAIGVAVGVLAAFHIYLICSGQTTIEWFENWSARRAGLISRAPFDAGVRANVELSFGRPRWAFLPWWSVLLLPDLRRVATPHWMLHPSSSVSM